MHQFLLAIHNIVRWLSVIMMALVLTRAYRGMIKKTVWTPIDRKFQVILTILLDSQVLLGLTMYFFTSQLTRIIFTDSASAMANPTLRFFSVEHASFMVLALICAHVGSIVTKKAESSEKKHRQSVIWFTISMLLIVIGIPWPFSTISRPWLPF